MTVHHGEHGEEARQTRSMRNEPSAAPSSGLVPIQHYSHIICISVLFVCSVVKCLLLLVLRDDLPPTNENRPRAFRLPAGGISGLKSCGSSFRPWRGHDVLRASRVPRFARFEPAGAAKHTRRANLEIRGKRSHARRRLSLALAMARASNTHLLKRPAGCHARRATPPHNPLPLKPTLLGLVAGLHRRRRSTHLTPNPSRSPDHTRRGELERAPARAVGQAEAPVRRGRTRHRRRAISLHHAQTLRTCSLSSTDGVNPAGRATARPEARATGWEGIPQASGALSPSAAVDCREELHPGPRRESKILDCHDPHKTRR